MELHQVRYFLAVCETMNFTRAAARCHVSQPSLTRAIKVLEVELGGPLFNRERGNTHLTELGRAVQPHLREVAAQTLAARGSAAALLTLEDARLPLGVGFGFALDHVLPGLRAFAATYPEVAVELREADAPALHAAMRQGEIDVAFLPCRPHDIDDLHYHPVGLDHARILARAEHRLAQAAPLSLKALVGEKLAVREGCGFLPILRRRLVELGLSLAERSACLHAGPACGACPGLRRHRPGPRLAARGPGHGKSCHRRGRGWVADVRRHQARAALLATGQGAARSPAAAALRGRPGGTRPRGVIRRAQPAGASSGSSSGSQEGPSSCSIGAKRAL